MNSQIEKLAELIRESRNIVFFGGAGVSTESGIPDFRSAKGIYSEQWKRNYSPEEIISHTFYMYHPEEFWEFYKEKLCYPEAEPNECHKALAKLEEMGKLKAVVTQNIDGLHQKAGSKRVYELHGSVLRNYCTGCHRFYSLEQVLESDGVPVCSHCHKPIKPDVVLYEESLDRDVMDNAEKAIRKADMLIIGGTSLVVYPAAGLIHYFRGDHLVLINKTETSADNYAELAIHDSIGKVFQEVISIL